MTRRNDKRGRLVTAADKLFHEQGVSTTTLANIAQLADVPLGNVYYYFKSKESIVLAVIDYRRKLIQQQFDERVRLFAKDPNDSMLSLPSCVLKTNPFSDIVAVTAGAITNG